MVDKGFAEACDSKRHENKGYRYFSKQDKNRNTTNILYIMWIYVPKNEFRCAKFHVAWLSPCEKYPFLSLDNPSQRRFNAFLVCL